MHRSFLTFQRFNDPAVAETMAAVLRAYGIEVALVKDAPVFDPSYAFNSVDSDVLLTIRPADFTRAHQALVAHFRERLTEVDPDYYLFSFTDGELQSILAQPDAWGPFDYALAERILTDRGRPLTAEQTGTLQAARVAELAQPEAIPKKWFYLGCLSLVIFPAAACILGGITAYYKKTLPNGELVYAYVKADRQRGKALLLIGAIVQALMLVRMIW